MGSPERRFALYARWSDIEIVMASRKESIQREVLQVWAWLPAFRAVAEREHVHLAARDMNITPSSLSRAIHLVEANLARKLFERAGRNVKLTPAGRELLAAVRDGMRSIDDGLATVKGNALTGDLRVACEGDHPLRLLSHAASALATEHPALRVAIHELADAKHVESQLLRGDLDLVIASRAPDSPRLRVDELFAVRYGIYCSPEHPLAKKRRPALEEVLAQPFLAPTPRPGSAAQDNWPVQYERRVALFLPALEPAIAACASSRLLAVLPDDAVAVERARLSRLPLDIVPSSTMFAVRRKPLSATDRAGLFVAALREVMAHPVLHAAAAGGRTHRRRAQHARHEPQPS